MTISIADLCFQTKKIISEFGCKTKYLTFREEHRMTVMKVRALRRACGRNRENIEKYKLLSFTSILVRLQQALELSYPVGLN